MDVTIVAGELLYQQTDAIVNPWNQNILPWWLLVPHGVSGAIRKHGGIEPFRQLRTKGMIPLGGAVVTSAGKLPYVAIIHVATIDLCMRSTLRMIQDGVRSALMLAEQFAIRSLAFPMLGSGGGHIHPKRAEQCMLETFACVESRVVVVLVRSVS